MNEHSREVANGKRFEFGKNWSRFLRLLDDERIRAAEDSVRQMLELEDLAGRRFLDVGSGSGLFSLAARRLGATVTSFDFDPQSVACTSALRSRYCRGDEAWTVLEGSVLDAAFVRSLGTFDIVYSWGVLHHTGAMRQAMGNLASSVEDRGRLCIAIYADQGWRTDIWRRIKRLYCAGILGKTAVVSAALPCYVGKWLLEDLYRRQAPWSRYAGRQGRRGMALFPDLFDWLGGYPFEAATVDQVFDFYRVRGFRLVWIKTSRGGNNEFVFEKNGAQGEGKALLRSS